MKRELDEKLVAKYPEIFKNRKGSMKTTAMCWGFECGDGWYDLIDNLCDNLMKLSTEVDPPHVPVAVQVKEKFGTLRFYLESGTDAQFDACSDAGRASESICETCGEPGKLRGGGWWYVACDNHTDPEDLKEDVDLP